MPKPRVYLAGPLFTENERTFNTNLAWMLSAYFEVYLPQRDGGLIADLVKSVGPQEAARTVFETDMRAMRTADIVIAVLDGRTIDEGVAVEIGFCFGQGKKCVGLQTDTRRLLPQGNNPMVDGCLSETFRSVEELVVWAREYTAASG